jgi:YVTN family beta-propeller protein
VLQVQAEPVRVLFPFEAARRRAAVIALSLRFPESVGSGYRFAPAFAATGPRTLAIGLTGLASCRGAGVVMMFDRTSGSIVSVVPVGADPEGIAVDSGRFRGYVAVAGADRVEAIGLPEQVALDRVQLSGGDRPSELVLTPDGRRLLVVNSGSNTVSVLDARTLVEAKRISVGNGPSALVLDRTGRRAFVLNTLSDSVSFIDVRLPDEVPSAGALSYQPTVTIGVDAGPVRGALDRSGERLFVGHGPSPYLTVLDTKTLAVSRRVYVGTGAMAMTVDPRTDRLYLARRGAGGVEVFDPGSLLPVDFIRADGDVGDLVVDAEANTLFLALPEVNEVRAVTLIGKRSVVALDAGETPYRLALAGAR